MTDKPTPTDAELKALLLDKLPASKHYIRPVIEKMVAAMQAAIDKWGTPAPVGVEPSYTSVQLAEMVLSDCGHSSDYTPLLNRVAARIDAHAERCLDELRVGLEPQPVAREQLTDEQIQDLLLCGNPTDEEMRLIRIGWDAARGIKGGQHGTE